jgi:hypothetical protein
MKLAMIAASLILAGSAQAQSLKEKDEHEKCGKQAVETFKKTWGEPVYNGNQKATINHESHYSLRLNKCFYLQTQIYYVTESDKIKDMTFYDLHENREIGTYSNGIALCSVQGQQCTSEQEWRALIKPFMED